MSYIKNNFNVWMIVYSSDKNHVDNFNVINKDLHTNYFSCADTINNFKKYCDFGIHKNYITSQFKTINKRLPLKISNNLSHQFLLEKILDYSNTEWNLILEDNVEINTEKFMNHCLPILEEANKYGSSFIQLYIHPKFINLQTKGNKEIYDNLYEMTFQMGSCAYFIKKSAIEDFIQTYPLSNHIDIEYGNMIQKWKSLSWVNSGITLSEKQELQYYDQIHETL